MSPRLLILWAGALLAAPYPGVDDKYRYTCEDELPCFKSVSSARPLTVSECGAISMDIAMAMMAFEQVGLANANEVCDTMGEVRLRIRKEPEEWFAPIPGNSTRMVIGLYDPQARWIEVSRSMDALGHECLHAWEHLTGSELGEHPGSWDNDMQKTSLIEHYEVQAIGLGP